MHGSVVIKEQAGVYLGQSRVAMAGKTLDMSILWRQTDSGAEGGKDPGLLLH